MNIDNYNSIKDHFQLICFAAGSPIFVIMASHVLSTKFSRVMNALSIVKLTWALMSFVGRENLGIQHTIKRLIISALLIGMCFFEMTNRQFFLQKTFIIGIDFFFTFLSLIKYYFQWVNYFLKVGGILENAYLIQSTIISVAVWKTFDPTVKDRVLPFALAYVGSIVYYAVFYIIQFYIIQKGKRLTPEPEVVEKEDTETNKKKTEANDEKNKKETDLKPDQKDAKTKVKTN